MSKDFRIRIRHLARDSYEDDHSSSWNFQRWTPAVTTVLDRRIVHTILIQCFKQLQSGNTLVWWDTFEACGREWRMFVCVGNKRLESLGVSRQRQAVKQLAAKMRRLLAQKSKAVT